ncbi:hypothetical protein LAZ67_17000578 [Cordylochernes scorpioides]|uniref:Peptidase A2 domain-containing protein n=1 Tax=Cordylochernes scorpioides TaxID=51811 RepID=A0ABY6LH22_9ARAC|nr:hypothetical protein LAZ67_17000578 [Cordylochernes scorpioides]
MRTLKTDKDISEKVLQTLWMDKLPEIIKYILVVSVEGLDKLAEMADKIQEMNPQLQVYESKNKDPTFEEMTATIASLKEELATLKLENRTRLNRRSNSPRPRQRSRSRSRRYNPSGKYCYFHYRFGNKCRPDRFPSPCQWKKPSGKLQRVRESATDPTAQWTNACRKSRLFVTDAKTGMRFLIDSGADVSLIPFKGNGTPTEDIQLYAANGGLIPTYGFQRLDETSKQIAVEESKRAQVEKRCFAEESKMAQVKKSGVEDDESHRAEVEKESVEADEEKGLDVEQGMDSENTEEVELLYAEQGTDSKMEENLDAEQGTESKVEEKIIDPKDWFKSESRATPIRPVCDGASCRGRSGLSLRRYLKKIPNLLRGIPEIGIKLRENRFGVLVDVGRYFRMIAIKNNDWDYLRFLWKEKMDN